MKHTAIFFVFFLTCFSARAQHGEYLDFNWNELAGDEWKVAYQNEDQQMLMLQYIPSSQNLETWREIGTIQMIKMEDVRSYTPQEMMEIMFKQGQTVAPDAKLTYIDKNDSVEYPWIQFKIEAPTLKDAPSAESQLYHMIQGKETLFVLIWGIRRWEIEPGDQTKWMSILSRAKVGVE